MPDLEKEYLRIRVRILVPVVIALTTILAVSLYSIYWLQQHNMYEDIEHEIKEVESLFPTFLKNESNLLAAQLDNIKNNKDLQEAWAAKDRKLLLQYALPPFQYLKSSTDITHFYFINIDRSCFLRVHNPPRHSDILDRFTLFQAIRQGEPARGIELGPFGTFTLRVVIPWIINGKLTGYLELGKEVDHLAPELEKILGVKLFFTIEKKYLDREKWEEGLKMMGHSGRWDQFKDFVIIYKPLDKIPSDLSNIFTSSEQINDELIFDSTLDDIEYRGGFLSLLDAGSRHVGNIIILNNITDEKASARTSLITQLIIFSMVAVLLFIIFYTYISRIENTLIKASDNLQLEIQERTNAENALRESEERYRAIAESTPDAIITTNSATKILLWNKAAESIFGYTQNEIIGKSSKILVPERVRELEKLGVERSAKTGISAVLGKTVESVGLRKDGSEFPTEVSLSSWSSGGEAYYAAIIRDITERKKAEDELAATRDALFRKEKLAVLGQLAGGLGHELRKPLAVIKNACYFLKSKKSIITDNAVKDNIDIINAEIELCNTIISDILDFSRVKKPVMQQIGLNKLLTDALSRIILPRNIHLETNFTKDIESVLCDPLQISQLFNNLIDNAVQAMPDGGSLKIYTHKKNNAIEVVVADDGCGIPSDRLSRIFEPLVTGKESGVGLGLAICKKLAEVNHATILVESSEGKGSTFTLRFDI